MIDETSTPIESGIEPVADARLPWQRPELKRFAADEAKNNDSFDTDGILIS